MRTLIILHVEIYRLDDLKGILDKIKELKCEYPGTDFRIETKY